LLKQKGNSGEESPESKPFPQEIPPPCPSAKVTAHTNIVPVKKVSDMVNVANIEKMTY